MAAAARGQIRIGIGGWTYAPWRGTFYPTDLTQKRELEYASRHLTSIEINGTFYGLQKPATFAKWRDETPDGFVFSVKAPRFTTHRKALAEAGPGIDRFLGSGLAALKDKLGPINWQFAPTKHFDAADFAAFLGLLPAEWKGHALRHAVEVRHASFQCAAFIDLMCRHEVGVVLAGDSVHPQFEELTAPFVYARIMGTSATQKRGYSARALDAWASRVRSWAAGEKSPPTRSSPPARSPHPAKQGKSRGQKPRDVYLYVISGHKERNPAAAMALLERMQGFKLPARSSGRR